MADDRAGRPVENRLFAAIPSDTRGRLAELVEPVELLSGQTIHPAGQPVRSVYFPTGAVVSLVSALEGEPAVEVALIGNEGVLGLAFLLGVDAVPFTAVCQLPGAATCASSTAAGSRPARAPATR